MQKTFAYITGSCLIINVLLNIFLIPPYSYVGASIATVITSLINFLLLYYYSIKAGYHVNIPRIIAKPLASSIVMAAFIFFFGAKIHLLALVPIACLIYLSLLVLLRDITQDDITGIF